MLIERPTFTIKKSIFIQFIIENLVVKSIFLIKKKLFRQKNHK